MTRINLLDCTLRDGGYVNNWSFGEDKIHLVTKCLCEANMDIVELGFLRNETVNINQSLWNSLFDVSAFIPSGNGNTEYAVMIDGGHPFQLEKIPNKSETAIDIIRVIVWSSKLNEMKDYCKHIVEKGYKVFIQPDRVNQYSLEQFASVCEMFSDINPSALYVVDSNGVLDRQGVLKYINVADKHLNPDIMLGYHGHNNLLQAQGAAEAFVELNLKRSIIIDGSIRGIGRSGGNLNIEVFATYLNRHYDKNYRIFPLMKVYDLVLDNIFKEYSWGYSLELFLSSIFACNPNYAQISKCEKNLSLEDIYGLFSIMPEDLKVITNKERFCKLVDEYMSKKE